MSFSSIATTDKTLAAQLQLPWVSAHNTEYSILLTFVDNRLVLQPTGTKAPHPIYVDFLAGKLAHRRQFGGGRGQLIAKAVGLPIKKHLAIIDATAGLGSDAFVLATLGCTVTMVERSPIIAALLKDGMERAQQADWFRALSLTLVIDDALHYLSQLKKY